MHLMQTLCFMTLFRGGAVHKRLVCSIISAVMLTACCGGDGAESSIVVDLTPVFSLIGFEGDVSAAANSVSQQGTPSTT